MASFNVPRWLTNNANQQFQQQAFQGLAQSFLQGQQLGFEREQQKQALQQEQQRIQEGKQSMGGFLKGLRSGNPWEAAEQNPGVFVNPATRDAATSALRNYTEMERISLAARQQDTKTKLSREQQALADKAAERVAAPGALPDEVKTQYFQMLQRGQRMEAAQFVLGQPLQQTVGADSRRRDQVFETILREVSDLSQTQALTPAEVVEQVRQMTDQVLKNKKVTGVESIRRKAREAARKAQEESDDSKGFFDRFKGFFGFGGKKQPSRQQPQQEPATHRFNPQTGKIEPVD